MRCSQAAHFFCPPRPRLPEQPYPADYPPEIRTRGAILSRNGRATDEQLRARRMDVYGRLALFAMAQAKAEDFLERLAAGWQDEIRLLARVSEGRLYALFRYTLRVNPNADHDTVKRFVTEVADDKVEKTMITASNKLIDQGRQELLAEWRELTLSLLEERFGPLPQEITTRVAAADASALKQWTARIHKSSSLDQVFDPTP